MEFSPNYIDYSYLESKDYINPVDEPTPPPSLEEIVRGPAGHVRLPPPGEHRVSGELSGQGRNRGAVWAGELRVSGELSGQGSYVGRGEIEEQAQNDN